ncbi:rab GTPase-binding effector protein 2 isoform X2 [Carettochelys insculpta]|uniref:rab GTPase-binding effector protein 2 isoform X2 n=1 Tax=Carettochelys insculpta TaxID=44489 RepID=UPI003EC070F5
MRLCVHVSAAALYACLVLHLSPFCSYHHSISIPLCVPQPPSTQLSSHLPPVQYAVSLHPLLPAPVPCGGCVLDKLDTSCWLGEKVDTDTHASVLPQPGDGSTPTCLGHAWGGTGALCPLTMSPAASPDTISSYEVRLAALQQELHRGGQWGGRELSCLQQHRAQENHLDSLERQMEKEDSERLRSIVLPMEEEIAQLKMKLSRAEGLIRGLRGPEGSLCGSSESLLSDAEVPSQVVPAQTNEEGDEGSGPEGEEESGGSLAFARGCDSLSIASSSAGSPRPRRRPSPEHEDTASLLSTGTLVPESIYLPPPGFQLVLDREWAQLQLKAKHHQETLQQLEMAMQEKLQLQDALRRSSEDCAKQVLVLLDQIQNSEQLLQNLQATVSQTQHRTQEQIADLASSHKRLSYEVQRLSEENEGLRGSRAPLEPSEKPPLPSSVQELQALVRQQQEEAGTLRQSSEHQSERLRIEIVALREQLEEEEAARARLQGVLEAQLGAQREESRKGADARVMGKRVRLGCHGSSHDETLSLSVCPHACSGCIGLCTELMEASLCSVRSEMERLQQQLEQAEQRAQGLEQDVQRLQGDLAQHDQQGQTWEQEKHVSPDSSGTSLPAGHERSLIMCSTEAGSKARLEAVLSEQRGKLQRLQAELDTSEQVQRDFVRLSQALQVQLERIRQASSLEHVRSIVDGTQLKDVAELKEP